MPDPNAPGVPAPSVEPPSSARLLRSTLVAAVVAGVLLVTVVLPAEYGVDPTGVGRLLGLTEMGEIKMSLAREAALADSIEAATPQAGASAPAVTTSSAGTGATADQVATAPGAARTTPAANSHVTEIVLRPAEGKEIKLVMRKDARVTYSWTTAGGVVNYDMHADAPGISYHGYTKGTATPSDEGVLVAAFDGAHGWFWRNRGSETVTVTLRTNGDYTELKRM